MQAKKKLIARMAAWAGGLLVLAAIVGVASLLIHYQQQQHRQRQRSDQERQRAEEARAYVADLAKRIDRLPVDANLASELESHYFEERPRGVLYVWAMDASGAFSFGVPRAAFDKLNAVYDREVTPRLKEGVFIDRLSFLLAYIEDHREVHVQASRGGVDIVERRDGWPNDRWEPPGTLVLSTPLKAADGRALGSLYLKRVPAPEHYQHDDRVTASAATAGIVAFACVVFLWILLPTWVYVDARERGVRRAPLFAFLTVLSSVVGLLVYLIARPEKRTLTCPGCAREVGDGSFCPHCGRDLTRSFCPACRYPLQPEWVYCPACRSEVRGQPPAGTPVPEAG